MLSKECLLSFHHVGFTGFFCFFYRPVFSKGGRISNIIVEKKIFYSLFFHINTIKQIFAFTPAKQTSEIRIFPGPKRAAGELLFSRMHTMPQHECADKI